MVTFWIQLDFSCQAAPQEKIEFEVAHILLKDERFMSVQNKITRVLSLLQGLKLIF